MDSPASTAIKPTWACTRCAERKVKCDKQNPCNHCTRYKVSCIYRPPKLSRKKRKVVEDELVDERLKRYEALLQEKGIDPNQVNRTSEAEYHDKSSRSEVPKSVWKLPIQAAIFKPQLLHGRRGAELVDNSLWSRVAKEIHDAEDGLEEDLANDASEVGFAYVLGCTMSNNTYSHPSAEFIHQLWQTFLENVNPLTKLVHVPSLQPAIEKAINNIGHIPRGFEALMFAIYSMAILSLTEDECIEIMREARAVLLPRYVAATKAALTRANFISSTSIVVLQALALHILSIRDDYEPRAVWGLTGVAIRVAEGMGMRIDGTLLGLSPFETEIRRRIWWQLKMQDFRAAELCGQTKLLDFGLVDTSPKKPANINDSDMHPSMPQAASESARPTEMIWCMLRSELACFGATQKAKLSKLSKVMSTSEEYASMDIDRNMKEVLIKEFEDTMETKYLRFCDPSQPLHLMALLGARCTTNIVRFMAHHPRRWAKLEQVPISEQQLVWSISIQLLEQYNMMQSSPQLRGFAWYVPYSLPWHVVIHVLDTLRANPLHLEALKAWRLIGTLYGNNSEMLLSIEKPMFVAIGNLCLNAYSARAGALMKAERGLFDPPEYIAKLREQREAAKARKEAVITRSGVQENIGGENGLVTTDAGAVWPGTNPSSAEAAAKVQLRRYSEAKQPANPILGRTQTGDDAFWLSDALDDGCPVNGAADMMNLDADVILAQDYWCDTPNSEVIDWTQWDAWLGNPDPICPNFSAGSG